jgi:hypothetical protein
MTFGEGDSLAVYEAINRAIEEGRPAALAIVVATTGSSPGLPGFKMLVFSDGTSIGTVYHVWKGKVSHVLERAADFVLSVNPFDFLANPSGFCHLCYPPPHPVRAV